MRIKNRKVFIHTAINNLKYIDATELMCALREHIDWSKHAMSIPYKYGKNRRVFVTIIPDLVEVYF